MKKLAALVAGTALAAFAVACTDTTTTTNTNTNAGNVAVVTNSNTNSVVTSTNTNTSTTTRRTYNANITQAEYEKDKDRYGREAKEAGDTVGSTATDGWLWVKAKAALPAENDLRDSTINVDVENGVVTLRGTVASNDQVKKADAAAKSIDGEKSAKNMLKVSADGGDANKNANRSADNKNAH